MCISCGAAGVRVHLHLVPTSPGVHVHLHLLGVLGCEKPIPHTPGPRACACNQQVWLHSPHSWLLLVGQVRTQDPLMWQVSKSTHQGGPVLGHVLATVCVCGWLVCAGVCV